MHNIHFAAVTGKPQFSAFFKGLVACSVIVLDIVVFRSRLDGLSHWQGTWFERPFFFFSLDCFLLICAAVDLFCVFEKRCNAA